MPHARFENLTKEKRDRILEAAAKEFGTHGYDGASLNRVLSAAGISKGAAYYYFEDKADLFDAVMQHYMQTIFAMIAFPSEGLDRATFWQTIESWYRRAIAACEDTPWMLGLAKACWKLSRDKREDALGRLRERAREVMAQTVRNGQECGAVRSDLPLELLIELVVSIDDVLDRWMAANIDQLPPGELARAVDRHVGCFRRILEAREENAP